MAAPCKVEGCRRKAFARGWCEANYKRWRRTGDPGPPMQSEDRRCSVDDCKEPHYGRGWCQRHYFYWKDHGFPEKPTAAQNFWAKVDKNGPVPDYAPHLGPCWIWTAFIRSAGYAHVSWDGQTRDGHLIAYELTIGPVPEGLELDHLCRVRRCVNPLHLEPVTRAENLRRSPITFVAINLAKTHCPQGHPYDEANTYRTRDGGRVCRACKRERERERRLREAKNL
mgnify:CR=1 FL=1